MLRIIKKAIKVSRLFYWVEDRKLIARYAQLIADKYSWEITHSKDIPSLLETAEDLTNKLQDASDSKWQILTSLQESNQRLQQDIKRFEVEAIHLKQLVDEKNMVIDKLLAESQKSVG